MITKADLIRLAEPGIIARLEAMQAELNELARLFPHLVKNQDGTVPTVIPIVAKKGKWATVAAPDGTPLAQIRHSSSNGRRPQNQTPRKPKAERLADIRKFLQAHPGSSAKAIGAAVGLSANQAFKLTALIAHSKTTGAVGAPHVFTLKKG